MIFICYFIRTETFPGIFSYEDMFDSGLDIPALRLVCYQYFLPSRVLAASRVRAMDCVVITGAGAGLADHRGLGSEVSTQVPPPPPPSVSLPSFST